MFIPSGWVLCEYLRSHLLTGFPWALLGNSQYLNLPVIQIADICGVWGVSWVIVFVNACLWQAITRRSTRAALTKRAIAATLSALVVVLAYGYYRLIPHADLALREPLRIGLIQGNIPQEEKWDISKRRLIFGKYARMTADAAGEGLDLIVWPEASLPTIPEEDPAYFLETNSLAQALNTHLLIGAVTRRDQSYYNSALLLSGEGKEVQRYDKLHLVPFGEYIPLKKILPFLEAVVPIGDMTSGTTYTVLRIPGRSPHLLERDADSGSRRRYPRPIGCGVLICFEDVFPELSRQFARRGAEFLVNITNDAWYKMTTAAYQHLSSSVLRAVEVRRPLVRAANTGVSCVIESSGGITHAVKDAQGHSLFIDGILIAAITPARGLTFYARFGELPFFCIVGVALLWYSLHRLMRRYPQPRNNRQVGHAR